MIDPCEACACPRTCMAFERCVLEPVPAPYSRPAEVFGVTTGDVLTRMLIDDPETPVAA